jgi:glycosyltransferase involved in cell wall biosynthesis
MQNTPLVSVIIPTHNRPELLLEAIASVAAQTMTDWQAIIVDDGSNPVVNEQGIQAQFGNKFQFLRHAVAQGVSGAKSAGVSVATGKYLAFLDDDDLFAPTYLASAIEILEANPQISTLFMGIECFGSNAEWAQNDYDKATEKTLADAQGINKTDHLIQFDERLFIALLKSVPMPFQRPVTTRAHFQQVGLYQPDCELLDCDWALRATLNNVCGLFNVGLYLQRSAGQSYYSIPSRRIRHALLGFDMKKRLLADPRAAAYKSQLTESVLEAGRNVAWECMAQGKGIQAFTFLLGTLRYGISAVQLKFILHALYSCVSKK